MILSNLSSRGTIKGTIYRGGGGGVTDYNALSGKPQINDVTIEGNHSGNYYSLMDTDDIDIIKITDLQRGNNYGITLFGTNYGIINMTFDQNESGLVPGYSAADAGKILSTNGWIDAPISGVTVDVLWSGSETPTAGNPFTTTIQDISNYKAIVVEGYSSSNSTYDQSIIFKPQVGIYYTAYQYGDGALYWRLLSTTSIEMILFASVNIMTFTRVLGVK